MKYIKRYSILTFVIFCISGFLMSSIVSAADWPHPRSYSLTLAEWENIKKPFDDPTPVMKTHGLKKILPKHMWDVLTFDIDEMKKVWSEIVGFKMPDVVGKIAPEIKPGKYTWQDKQKYPGLKELMIPVQYERFKPGEPPFAGNLPEITVVPTRQYYYNLRFAEATKQYLGNAKLDAQGYLVKGSWKGGLPFPKPEGKFKAQQIVYNVLFRCLAWETNRLLTGRVMGYNKRLKQDDNIEYESFGMRLKNRTVIPPDGWWDKRAASRNEHKAIVILFYAPRDKAGMVQGNLYFDQDVDTPDQSMIYLPSMRRIRMMTGTDTQDAIGGIDSIYDDLECFIQRLSPTRYPYSFELLEEREFLCPAPSWDGANYISSENIEFRNQTFERRVMYVVKLTQQDPNYIYGSRVMYIDKEHHNIIHIDNYDQKERLYRVMTQPKGFHPEMGMFSWFGSNVIQTDYIDLHTTVHNNYDIPAVWSRAECSLRNLVKKGK